MDSSSLLHPKPRVSTTTTTTYGSLPTRRRTEFPESSPQERPPLAARHSSGPAFVPRRVSGLSDLGISVCGGGQLTQLQNGLSLGLGGYSSWLNLFLIFVPFGLVAGFLNAPPIWTFSLNFVGMVPLAMLLGKATEDIAEHTNQTFGALVNVTFGNAVELILCISALRAGKMELIQNTIAGSVLSNLLLVLGSAFFFGGLRYREQIVLPAVSEANADLLSFAVFGFSIPALFAMALPESATKADAEERMSLVTSICLLLIYCMYLYFQLYTHAELYESGGSAQDIINEVELFGIEEGDAEVEEEEEPVASLPVALGILIGMVVLVAFSSEMIVASIDGFSARVGLGEKFIAVVLLPVVGNAVEHMSAIFVARHNKIDLSIGIACGSSVQIALFAAPLLVVVSWMFGDAHLTLNFQLFETICLGFSVFVVNATLRDSRSNWLEGALLVMCYFILASAFYFMG